MNRKYSYLIILVVINILVGCGKTDKYESNRFTEDTFCEYYQNATFFDELQPLVCEYLNIFDMAYENSDKESYNTFVYDVERSEKIYNELMEYVKKIEESKDNSAENLINLRIIYYCSKISTNISEKDLALVIGSDSNKEWFEEFKFNLDTAYQNFQEYVE